MSFAFREHNYNLDDFPRCPQHGCVLVQITDDAVAVCLVEWLAEKTGTQEEETPAVRDVILRGSGKYDLPAVILSNGFLLPVVHALDIPTNDPDRDVDESLIGWRVNDVLYARSEHGELIAVELFNSDNSDERVMLFLDMQILIYLLFDDEIRKVEP